MLHINVDPLYVEIVPFGVILPFCPITSFSAEPFQTETPPEPIALRDEEEMIAAVNFPLLFSG